MAITRKQPPDFRKAEVSYITQRWKNAESCSLVGIGSIGKSNLIQHLTDPNTPAQFIDGVNTSNFRAILIDPNMLGPLASTANEAERCWAGYELIMHRLFMALYPFDMLSEEDAKRFYETYQSLQDGRNPLYAYMGLRYLEFGLDLFLRKNMQIVLMFDEFEELFQQMPAKFFITLRGLRDAHKTSLSFTTFSRSPLPVLVERYKKDALLLESFVELFNDNLYYVGPYSDIDARRMLTTLLERTKAKYSASALEFLLTATGRYAGLLRASFRSFEEHASADIALDDYPTLVHQLSQRQAVKAECQTIWDSLTHNERHILKIIAQLESPGIQVEMEQALAMLVQKRLILIDRSHHRLNIHPPIFREFVTQNPS